MKYQITVSGGEKYFITEEEAQNIAKGETKGLVFVPSVKGYINLSFVQSVVPENKVDRSKMMYGVLNNGMRVYKKYNLWYEMGTEKELTYEELSYNQILTSEEHLKYSKIQNKVFNELVDEICDCVDCLSTTPQYGATLSWEKIKEKRKSGSCFDYWEIRMQPRDNYGWGEHMCNKHLLRIKQCFINPFVEFSDEVKQIIIDEPLLIE